LLLARVDILTFEKVGLPACLQASSPLFLVCDQGIWLRNIFRVRGCVALANFKERIANPLLHKKITKIFNMREAVAKQTVFWCYN
jgi:hypothetical protein